jgi:hypothetical protein
LKKLKLCTPLKATKLEKNKGGKFSPKIPEEEGREKSKEVKKKKPFQI